MAYDFQKYQEQEKQKQYLKFVEYKEVPCMLAFREEERRRLEEYDRLCTEEIRDRQNKERCYRQMLDHKQQVHEKEGMKDSICMKI